MDRRAVGGRPFRGMGDRELERERGNGAPLRDRERDRPLPLPRGGPPPGDFPRGFGRAGSGGAPMGMMGGRAGDYGPPPIGRPGGPRGGPPPGLPLVPQQPEFIVDREKTCPMLVRVWVKVGSHHDPQEFEVRGKEPAGDIHIHTWLDATLRELTDLIQQEREEARSRGCRLSFKLVYPNKAGRTQMRQVGTVHSQRPAEDDNRTLKALNFMPGDYLDVALMAGF